MKLRRDCEGLAQTVLGRHFKRLGSRIEAGEIAPAPGTTITIWTKGRRIHGLSCIRAGGPSTTIALRMTRAYLRMVVRRMRSHTNCPACVPKDVQLTSPFGGGPGGGPFVNMNVSETGENHPLCWACGLTGRVPLEVAAAIRLLGDEHQESLDEIWPKPPRAFGEYGDHKHWLQVDEGMIPRTEDIITLVAERAKIEYIKLRETQEED